MNTERNNLNRSAESDIRLEDLDHADMARLVLGHNAALDELMERHAGKLFNYLMRCLQNEEDAADAAQETFVRVYQHRAQFHAGQKFATWLYAIATNLIKDRYRYRSRHPQVSLDSEKEGTSEGFKENLPDAGASPGEALQAEERVRQVRCAVESLPEELRVPLILSEYEDLSHAEVGTILKCSAKAVETRLYRARRLLRERLAAILGD